MIRALLASRPWPSLAALAEEDRDAVLDGMALLDYQSDLRRVSVEAR